MESTWSVAAGEAVAWVTELGYSSAVDAWGDRRGRPVRQTPDRLTLEHRLDSGRVLFRKLRSGRPADAENEWRRLHELAGLGMSVPRPLFFGRDGDRTAIGFQGVPGREVRQSLIEEGRPADFVGFFAHRVAPVVGRLHGAGLVHRDLYWNHLFAEGFESRGPEVAVIDVERVREQRFPRRRWLVKDLASLCSSWPLEDDLILAARCLRLLVPDPAERRRMWRPILRKAQRIRAHRPKWTGEPEGEADSWPPTS